MISVTGMAGFPGNDISVQPSLGWKTFVDAFSGNVAFNWSNTLPITNSSKILMGLYPQITLKEIVMLETLLILFQTIFMRPVVMSIWFTCRSMLIIVLQLLVQF